MMLKMFQCSNVKNKKGFTLIEALVSLALFSIIIGAALGVFVTVLKAQRKVLAQQEVLAEMSYALEYMSRAIRMAKKNNVKIPGLGSIDCLGGDVVINYQITPAGQGGIKFRNYKDGCQEFFLDDDSRLKETNDDGTFALTSPNINVTKFEISLSGEGQLDDLQPAVTLFIEITNSDQTTSQFQTTISQRDLDVHYGP